MTPKTPLEKNLYRLAEIKEQLDDAKELKAEFDAIKQEIFTILADGGTDKTKPFAGVYVTISRKTVPYISDSEALLHWFVENDYPDRDYMTDPAPDVVKIEQVAKDLLDAGDGELIPGLQWRTTETPSVRSAKEAK